MDCSMPGLPVPHYLLEFAQVPVHWIGNAINHLILFHPLFFFWAFKYLLLLFCDPWTIWKVLLFSKCMGILGYTFIIVYNYYIQLLYIICIHMYIIYYIIYNNILLYIQLYTIIIVYKLRRLVGRGHRWGLYHVTSYCLQGSSGGPSALPVWVIFPLHCVCGSFYIQCSLFSWWHL